MFYQPTLPTDLAPLSQRELEGFADCYSDFHKDAIGCRPVSGATSDPLEAAKEQERLSQWMREDERIHALRTEVARFDLSRALEYIMRSRHWGGPSMKRAFEIHMERVAERSWADYQEQLAFYGWEQVCYDLKLPYSDAEPLKAWYEGLAYGSAELFSRAA